MTPGMIDDQITDDVYPYYTKDGTEQIDFKWKDHIIVFPIAIPGIKNGGIRIFKGTNDVTKQFFDGSSKDIIEPTSKNLFGIMVTMYKRLK